MNVSTWVLASATTPSTSPTPPNPQPSLETVMDALYYYLADLQARVERLETDLIDPDGNIGGF